MIPNSSMHRNIKYIKINIVISNSISRNITKFLCHQGNQRVIESWPHMRIGAWSSRSIGSDKKSWRALTQSWRISPSDNCTCFPPLPSNSLLIISSNADLSIIPSIVIIIILSSIQIKPNKSQWTQSQINSSIVRRLNKRISRKLGKR